MQANTKGHLRMMQASWGTAGRREAAVADFAKDWLVADWFDILFVCGFAPWMCGLFALALIGTNFETPPSAAQHAMAALYIVASLVIGEAHQFTSIYRYYLDFKESKKYFWQRLPLRAVTAGIVLLFAISISLTMCSSDVLSTTARGIVSLLEVIGMFAMLLFPVALMQHLCAQAKAVGMAYCGLAKYSLSTMDRLLLDFALWQFVAIGGMTLAQPFADTSLRPAELHFDAWLPNFLSVSIATIIVISARFCVRGIRTGQWLPIGATALWCNLALFVLLQSTVMSYVWIFVPLLFHATQHWAIAWHTHKREAAAAGNPITSWQQGFVKFLLFAIPIQGITVAVLFWPCMLSWVSGENVDLNSTSTTLSVGWSMVVFYLHYFADRIVWRTQRGES